jgi:ABC-type uncharacterized transport system permease subunit
MVETPVQATMLARVRPTALDHPRRHGIALIALAAATACFGLRERADAVFFLSDFTSTTTLPEVVLPPQATALAAAAGVFGLALVQLGALGRRRVPRALALGLALAALVLAFLCWAVSGRSISVPGVLTATIALSLPIMLGAMTGVVCERAGVINIAIEAQFLASAFAASAFASVYGVWVGILTGSAAGALVAAALALFAIRFLADQVVVGIVLTLLMLGLTHFLFLRVIVPRQDLLNSPPILPTWRIPGLSSLPVIGEPLFAQNLIWYLAVGLLLALHVGLFHTRWGLRVQAVGENPEAAESVGISVTRTRYRNVIMSGFIAGLGGTFLTIGSIGAFSTGVTSGKGFIALAAVIFGRWRPLAACGAALAFGFADAAQSTLSVIGAPIPSTLLQMLPYLVTIAVLAGLVGRVRPPAADGKPFIN